MSYQFRAAVREQTSLMIGIAGPSGSGKTASALKMARGILGGQDEGMFVIDTEASRASHYACAPGEKRSTSSRWTGHLRPERAWLGVFAVMGGTLPSSYGLLWEGLSVAMGGLEAIATESRSHRQVSPTGRSRE